MKGTPKTVNKGDVKSSLSVRHGEDGHEAREPKEWDHTLLLEQYRWFGLEKMGDSEKLRLATGTGRFPDHSHVLPWVI